MITKHIEVFCDEDPTKIENYQEAINSSVLWECHHRLEDLGFSVKDLKAADLYFHRPASELIFMKKTDHITMHATGNHNNKGRHWSDQTKQLISEKLKGVNTWSKTANIGNQHNRGRHHYNNGIVEVFRFQCPEGFSPGRLKQNRKS